ncbi:MAG: imidazole glycerol phosphate synthase subunit HisH [Cucumibacter sp.]
MSNSLVIIDYGSGNLKSAAKAFERAAATLADPPRILVSSDPGHVTRAERLVLPGVGAFGDCRAGLYAVPGMVEALTEMVTKKAVPFFGICVGMQLMATAGLEKGTHFGFNWIPGTVRRISPGDPDLKIPHMGWNTIDLVRPHPVFDGIATGPKGLNAYFVHSYHFVPDHEADLLATADYGGKIFAAVARANMVGTQFHPEKSQALGLKMIENFLNWRP